MSTTTSPTTTTNAAPITATMPDSTEPFSRNLTLSDSPDDPEFDVSKVAGNVPLPVKHRLGNSKAYFGGWIPSRFQDPSYIFGRSIADRFRVTEVSVDKKRDEESKPEGRVVVELEVTGGAFGNTISSVNGYLLKLKADHCLGYFFAFCFSFSLEMINGAGNIHGGCSAYLVDM